jgi:ABC-type branched-subunit amino acid transport system substrate-binding protein/ABC-type amino acid transport substrate-binding protein
MRTALLATLISLLTLAAAQTPSAPWEMRICSPAYNPPAASDDLGGYDMEIAAVLADELGARVSYEWILLERVGVQNSLHLGHCDLIFGIGESVAGVTSSVPYLRAPYVFVTLAERNIAISSLDDPILESLTIATYPAGLPSVALRNRGIVDNVLELSPVAAARGLDRDAALLSAVFSGEADVAIMYAGQASVAARENPGLLLLDPVTPELDFGANILPLYRTFTIGVRPHDERFRDQINIALAKRWDDIAAIFAEYQMPTTNISRPPVPVAGDDRLVRIGVIAPARTRQAHGFEAIGEAQRLGAILAENSIARLANRDDVRFEVHFASAPNEAAAIRAAERLLQVHGVSALVGGFDEGSSAALHQLAANYQVPFFNIGSADMALRNELCAPTTFHVEASSAMYLDALINSGVAPADRKWFIVFEADLADEALLQRFEAQLNRAGIGGKVVGQATAQPRQFVYFNELNAINAAAADAVLLMLGTEATDQFLVQFGLLRSDAELFMVLPIAAQSREVMLRYAQSSAEAGGQARPTLWDPALADPEADDLNTRYSTRNALPMDPAAWGSYAAVMSLFEATRANAIGSLRDLIGFLTDPAADLALGKGVPLSYRPWDHQLRQPIYLSRIVPDARWGSTAANQIALGEVIATAPGNGLDLLGDDADRSLCRF